MQQIEENEEKPKRLSFSETNDLLQISWDSTSLGALKRCPRYYYYNIIMGYVHRGENAHLTFGSAYNNSLVYYQIRRANGIDYENAVVDAVRYALSSTWNEKLGRPWTSDEPTKTRETLVRTVIWYLDQFKDDVLETVIMADGRPAVELPFRIDIGMHSEITGEDYSLCGYLDQKVEGNLGRWIKDWKTTKYALDDKYFQRYTPDNQVSQYAFAGQIMDSKPVSGVVIDAAQLGVTFSRFQRATIGRTTSQLEEWITDSKFYIRQNEEFVALNYWPQNDTSCEKYGGCPYREICATTPKLRQTKLDAMFQTRIWDPLREREILGEVI